MIYELRQYEIKAGRMADCHRLFREVALPVFAEVGIETLGFWEALDEEARSFVYLLAFADAAGRERGWADFLAHPRWLAEKASWQDGPPYAWTRGTLLAPTDYSPLG